MSVKRKHSKEKQRRDREREKEGRGKNESDGKKREMGGKKKQHCRHSDKIKTAASWRPMLIFTWVYYNHARE